MVEASVCCDVVQRQCVVSYRRFGTFRSHHTIRWCERAHTIISFFSNIDRPEVFILKILLILSFPFSILIFVMSLPPTHFLVCTKYSSQHESSYVLAAVDWLLPTVTFFPVSTRECWDGSQVSKLLLHASYVALPKFPSYLFPIFVNV
jgi:hypothetical protein